MALTQDGNGLTSDVPLVAQPNAVQTSQDAAPETARTLLFELRNEHVLEWLMQNAHNYQIGFHPIVSPALKAPRRYSPIGGQAANKRRSLHSAPSGISSKPAKRFRGLQLREIGSSKVSKNVVIDMKQPIERMVDSSSMFQSRDAQGLWLRYMHDGYLYLPQVLDPSVLREAHDAIMHGLQNLNVVAVDGLTAAADSGWTVSLKRCQYVGSSLTLLHTVGANISLCPTYDSFLG